MACDCNVVITNTHNDKTKELLERIKNDKYQKSFDCPSCKRIKEELSKDIPHTIIGMSVIANKHIINDNNE
jgi:hypothetical protein